ncbi:MAG: GNAT family N-acetyltransferase [Bdellovibrionales bacterium]|nr:GNAT family N-acetyltransferase [Bdellovibrionales bacterium]
MKAYVYSPGLKIRPARMGDARALAEVHTLSWWTSYRGIIADSFLKGRTVEKRLAMWMATISEVEAGTTRKALRVADHPERGVVGFAIGVPERSQSPHADAELGAIYLLQDFQRNGIGQALLLDVALELQKFGFKNLLCWALEKNPARKFYEQLGGRPLPETKTVDFGGELHQEIGYVWSLDELVARLSQSP